MSPPAEPVFGGTPQAPPPEVFARARAQNPAWYQVMEQAYEQFATRPENQGRYADPKGSGGTVQQIWMTYTLFGLAPCCLLAGSLAPERTSGIRQVVRETPEKAIALLKQLRGLVGSLNVPTLHYDGVTGHNIRLTDYQPSTDRFVYHDPWPEESLLCRKNNVAGVDAHPEGSRWSVSAAELARVIFACFIFLPDWARLQGQPVGQSFETWKQGEFVGRFMLREIGAGTHDELEWRSFAPGAFKNEVLCVVGIDSAGLISEATLSLEHGWIRRNVMLALDIARRFLICFAPAPERDEYAQLAAQVQGLRDQAVVKRLTEGGPPESEGDRLAACVLGLTPEFDRSSDFSSLTLQHADRGAFRALELRFGLAR